MPDVNDSAAFADRRARFRRLHESGCLVLPNPWDIGSARYLAHLGFEALATTSAGMAFAAGLRDGAPPVELVLAHVKALAEATDLPLNVDFEDGHAADLDGVNENVRLCVEAGASGLSIEDATGDRARPLYPFEEAVARVAAARRAIDATGADVLLTARAEAILVRAEGLLDEVLRRLAAFAEAGADCLYAPGLSTAEQVRAVVAAVAPKPLNVLALPGRGPSIAELADLGVRRVSVGGALAAAAWGGFIRAAQGLKSGSLDGFGENARYADIVAGFPA